MNYVQMLYPYRLEIGIGILVFLFLVQFVLSVRAYRMLKYLTGGRTWPKRFKLIKERFRRLRRDHGVH